MRRIAVDFALGAAQLAGLTTVVSCSLPRLDLSGAQRLGEAVGHEDVDAGSHTLLTAENSR